MRSKLLGSSRLLAGILASGALGWLSIRGLDWELVGQNLAQVSFPLLALALVVFILAGWLRALRWHMLFVNQKLSVGRLFIIQHEGLGLSNIMPVRIASEVTQLAVLTMRDGVRGSTALAALGMERVVDVVASTLILAISFLLVPQIKEFGLFVWGAIAFAATAVALVRLLAWSSVSIKFIRRVSFLASFATAVRELEHERARLLGSFLISVVYWIMVGITAWIVAQAIELEVSPMATTLVIMGTIFFTTALPAAPSAIGTFEFAVVYVLGIIGVDKADAFGYAVMVHLVLFLPPTIIAAVFLPREGISLRRRPKLAPTTVGDGSGR